MSPERGNNYQSRAEEAQRRAEQRARESQERAERRAREAQERNERLSRQAQERAERLAREAQERAERLSRQAQERAERMAHQDRERAERRARQDRERAQRAQSYGGAGFDPFEDAFKRMFEQFHETQTASSRESVGPAEMTRRRLLATLPREIAQTLTTCDQSNVRNFIATVQKSREVNPERTDWNIYLSYRRAIETDDPEPNMVEKTQIAWLLIEDSRRENGRHEARFPF